MAARKGSAVSGESAPGWEDRVVDRFVRRAQESARNRTLGSATRTVEAAIELAAESGGATFTVQQVVDRAGVALQTFYRQFGSKDALMLAVFEQTNRVETARIQANADAAGDPLERLRMVVMTPIRTAMRSVEGSLGPVIARELGRFRKDYREELASLEAPYLDLAGDAIRRAEAAGYIHCDDPERAAMLILGLVQAAFHQSVFLNAESDVEKTEAFLWDFCLRGLGGEPAP
jgi:AcrR family transcriptional regulator